MKKLSSLILVLVSASLILIVFAMKPLNNNETSIKESAVIIEIPEDVQSVLDKSCMACHSEDSKNAKAKLSISFDKLKAGEYSIGKVIGKLNNIIEVTDDGSMPPKKFIEKNPKKALSEKESKLLKNWANETIKKYSEE